MNMARVAMGVSMRIRALALTAILTAVLSITLGGCSRPAEESRTESRTEAVTEARPEWAEFANTTIAEYYRRNPETAVNAGLHEYDGRMRDLSLAANQEYLDWLERTYEEYNRVNGYPPHRDIADPAVARWQPSFAVTRRMKWRLRQKPLRWLLHRLGLNPHGDPPRTLRVRR